MNKTNLQKLLEAMMMNNAGPNFYGNPSFGGTGNYGMGGPAQLAHFGLNPATEKVAEQERDEAEENFDDQQWINGKGLIGRAFKDVVAHWDGRNGAVETVAESAPYDNSVSRMRDLPGFPAPDTLVNPKQFTPMNAGPDYENPIDGRKVEYLGPTLDGVPLDDMTGNSSALALQLSERDKIIRPLSKKQKQKQAIDKKLDKLIGPDPDISSDTKHEKDAADLILYDYIKDLVRETIQELLGAPKATTPDRLGWNNTRTNSLAAWRNHRNPDQDPPETWRPQFGENSEQNPSIIYEPPQRSPLGSSAAIGWPKQFVPADYEATFGKDEGFGEDILGARRLRQSPVDDDRVGVNASIREAHMKQLKALLEYLLNEEGCYESEMEEVAPPGKEHVVRALKKRFPEGSASPYRIAWAMHNKELEESTLSEGIDEGENAPTNPSLWSRAKAQAKKKFDVYPCVPLSSKALTKDGWKTYNELSIGDVICTYNISEDCLEWKPIQYLHFYNDAETINVYTPQTNFNFVCTPNHKWVLKKTWADINEDKRGYRYWKEDHLVEAKDINKKMKIITSAKLKDNNSDPILLENFSKYGESWVQKITRMSNEQREAFFAAAIVYDGHEKLIEDSTDERAIRYGFSQKNSDHGEAVEICAALLGYRVSFRNKKDNSAMTDWTFSRRNTQGTNNVFLKSDTVQDVWCPQTENSTWLMKQDGMITITGNSAYANAWAAKWYKSKGGGWRKKGKKKK